MQAGTVCGPHPSPVKEMGIFYECDTQDTSKRIESAETQNAFVEDSTSETKNSVEVPKNKKHSNQKRRSKPPPAKKEDPVPRYLPPPGHEGFLDSVSRCIIENLGPYKLGEWQRKPWPRRPYEKISAYCVPADVPEPYASAAMKRLETGLPDDWMSDETRVALKDQHGDVEINFKDKEPLEVGVDIEERDLWGLDGHARTAIVDVLRHIPSMCDPELQSHFVERMLLPAANSLGDRGWDIIAALELVGRWACDASNEPYLEAALALQQVVRELDQKPKKEPKQKDGAPEAPEAPPTDDDLAALRLSFRLHPKGMGVVCIRDGGIPAGRFVDDYLGEVYPPWRWYERQDALKKLNKNNELPDFYNITLESPSEDSLGHDVVFVEAAMKSTVASRLSHSCTPNCVNIPTVRNGKHVISMFTSRHVEKGEELCWDYACVTDSRKEYCEATCLCGTSGCRGSFLHFIGPIPILLIAAALPCRGKNNSNQSVQFKTFLRCSSKQDGVTSTLYR
mmetsp:Transcript_3241/g.7629  ORF Transcript_3241/g.7629 Transcript_3241/m.7629 type:complete len:508 (-) Transcript_3241:628-2151(-)